MAFQDYFSIVAFFIFLRETLEAAVIIAVLLQVMNRTMPRLKRQVWFGAAAGIGVSIIFGAIFAGIFYAAKTLLFQGTAKAIFQGVISYVAVILISYLAFAMLRFANVEEKYAKKLSVAAKNAAANSTNPDGARSKGYSAFVLAFTAVLREGIEAVIFLAGVGSQTGIASIPLAALAGLVVGLAVGLAIYYSGRAIKDLKIFFVISTIILFFIAAGQVSLGTQMLSLAGAFGPYAIWQDQLTWQYYPVADLTHCCGDELTAPNKFFPLAHAVVGYQAKPTPIILILYCTYWAVVTAVAFYKWRNGSLFYSNAEAKRKRTALNLDRAAAAAARRAKAAERKLARTEAAAEKARAAGAPDAATKADAAAAARGALEAARAEADAARAAHAEEVARLNAEDAALMAGESTSEGSGDDAAVAVAGGKDVEMAGVKDAEVTPAGDAVTGDQEAKKGGWFAAKLRAARRG
ncbi:Plasma membrane iron permease [Monoraphidium neglectum]|uniref:Plasma membrane iron permease n=1 Tax=Monoraphidium neglectum TaxID=145388 RepID=A0A0D2M4L7_9CHLO|nr:Plasma membrane iron permease [Monoraphidium neglectum]KIY96211.1 Plasma membrane iron permease [Monoraphidium neglectum]|eukprot:XP_013895231.1 Plasma membrane iron permease [Monoraphidium neglectum]